MDRLMQHQRRRILTDRMVAALPRRRRRYTVADPEQRGLYVRVPASGPSSFVAVARDPNGQQVWATLGSTDTLGIKPARDKARGAIQRIREGLSPFETPPAKPDAFRAVAENWVKRHVDKNKLRTQPEIERVLNVYVYPHWADRPFTGIRRSDFTALLDRIEDERGSRMADIVFGVVRSIGNWHVGRDDTYLSPFNVRGQRRSSGAKRSRILTDDELRKVWKEAEVSGSFGALIRFLLLCGQRRGAVLKMKWSDLSDDGTWKIQSDPREKINAGSLRLPAQALAIINAQPRCVSNPYVFAASRGNGPMNGFSRAKVLFDKECGVTDWTLHDLRRCCRSLLARCDVRPDIAEVTLGHVVAGIEGRYNVHDYSDQKAIALAKLAALINTIVNPPKGGNIVTMAKKRA